MKRLTALGLAFGLMGAVTLAAPQAIAADAPKPKAASKTATTLSIKDPWVREAPPGARVLGAYMVLANPSSKADRLVSVTSPLADEIEIHRMTVKNGMMEMDAVDSLTIPAKGEVKLQPGGLHLMIYGVKRDLKEGDSLPIELTFENAGTRKIDFPVRKYTGGHHHKH